MHFLSSFSFFFDVSSRSLSPQREPTFSAHQDQLCWQQVKYFQHQVIKGFLGLAVPFIACLLPGTAELIQCQTPVYQDKPNQLLEDHLAASVGVNISTFSCHYSFSPSSLSLPLCFKLPVTKVPELQNHSPNPVSTLHFLPSPSSILNPQLMCRRHPLSRNIRHVSEYTKQYTADFGGPWFIPCITHSLILGTNWPGFQTWV